MQEISSNIISKIKETIKHLIVYGMGSLIQGLVGVLLLPILSKYFTTIIFGRYTIILLLGTFSGSLMYLGASSAFARFYFDSEDVNYKIKITTNSLIIAVFGSVLQTILILILAPTISLALFKTKHFAFPIILSVIGSSLGIINAFLLVYVRTLKKSLQFVLINSLNYVVNILSIYLFFYFNVSEQEIIIPFLGIILGNTASILVLIKPISQQIDSRFLSIKVLQKLLVFGVPTIINGFIFYLLDWSDRFLIEHFATFKDVGIYSFGYKIGMLVQVVFIIPFSMIWTTLRMEYAKDKDTGWFFSIITTYYTMIGLFLVLLVSISSEYLVHILASKPEYYLSYEIIPWVILGQFLLGYGSILDFGIYYSTKVHHYIWIYSLSLVVNVTLNYILLPLFGYYIAAVNTTISYLMVMILIYTISQKYFKFKIEWRRIFILFLSVITAILFSWRVYSRSFISSILIVLCVLFVWYVFVLSRNEKQLIVKMIEFIKQKVVIRV